MHFFLSSWAILVSNHSPWFSFEYLYEWTLCLILLVTVFSNISLVFPSQRTYLAFSLKAFSQWHLVNHAASQGFQLGWHGFTVTLLATVLHCFLEACSVLSPALRKSWVLCFLYNVMSFSMVQNWLTILLASCWLRKCIKVELPLFLTFFQSMDLTEVARKFYHQSAYWLCVELARFSSSEHGDFLLCPSHASLWHPCLHVWADFQTFPYIMVP